MTITGPTKDYSCYFGEDGYACYRSCVEVRGQLASANSPFHHVSPKDQTQVINSADD